MKNAELSRGLSRTNRKCIHSKKPNITCMIIWPDLRVLSGVDGLGREREALVYLGRSPGPAGWG